MFEHSKLLAEQVCQNCCCIALATCLHQHHESTLLATASVGTVKLVVITKSSLVVHCAHLLCVSQVDSQLLESLLNMSSLHACEEPYIVV